jgi:ParB-like chromosome segregation protein Spo0J
MAKRRGAKTENPPGAIVGKIADDLLPLALPIDSFVLDPANCRKHDRPDIDAIKASLQKFGQRVTITVNTTTGYVSAGNGRVMAARELGWTHLAAVRVKDDPATATGWAIADNRTAELSAWDTEALLLAAKEVEAFDADLYESLMLDELLPSVSAEAPAEPIEIPSKYSILIECISETQQREIYERLQAGNYPPAKCLTI